MLTHGLQSEYAKKGYGKAGKAGDSGQGWASAVCVVQAVRWAGVHSCRYQTDSLAAWRELQCASLLQTFAVALHVQD